MVRSQFTKRNHYNPCFWTALWNNTYFEARRSGTAASLAVRTQTVSVLNIRSDAIYTNTVENIHFDKDLGVAEITPEQVKDFCKRRFPSELKSIEEYVAMNPQSVFLDFEDVLEHIDTNYYDYLIQAAIHGDLSSMEHKGFITCILILHALRSHEMMNSMVGAMSEIGIPKWEYFWLLKNALGNPLILARAVTPLVMGQWTVYRTAEHRFPLCDSPIMIGPDSLMAVLSPRLLLEIDLNARPTEEPWKIHDGIESEKYNEFRLKSLNNTFKEIIFSDAEELKKWQQLPEYRARRTVLQNPDTRRQAVAAAANWVIFALNGFGRTPREFDERFKRQFPE